MERQVALAVAAIQSPKAPAFDVITMRYTVAVAREVVGLTDSSLSGMSTRLNRFFGTELHTGNRLVVALKGVRASVLLWHFHQMDVKPAVKARRAAPKDDVVSYLIEDGRNDAEILTECITYAAAGMVTTREFITLVTWQMLTNEPLRQRYLAAEQPERYQILTELLRVDPVVGKLHRRVTEPVTVSADGESHTLPAGAKVDVLVRQTNADASVVGECPMQVDPDRRIGGGLKPDVMAFGEGAHRCPGSFIAIQETDMLLRELLRLPLKLVTEPTVDRDPLLESYTLRGMVVTMQGS